MRDHQVFLKGDHSGFAIHEWLLLSGFGILVYRIPIFHVRAPSSTSSIGALFTNAILGLLNIQDPTVIIKAPAPILTSIQELSDQGRDDDVYTLGTAGCHRGPGTWWRL